MRIFIVGCNYPERESERAALAALTLQNEGHEVYEPISYENILTHGDDCCKIDDFEDVHMQMLDTCDAIFVLQKAEHDGKAQRYIKSAIVSRINIFFEEG